MSLNVAPSGGRPNFLPVVIRASIKRANNVVAGEIRRGLDWKRANRIIIASRTFRPMQI